MTIEETAEILDLLTAAYPQFYAKKSDAELDSVTDLWATIFARDDVRIVLAAVRSFIESDEKGFPPVPGQVRAKIRLIVGRAELSEAEAWGLVMDILDPDDPSAPFIAMRHGEDYMEEGFRKLPSSVRRAVGSVETLCIWRSVDRKTLFSVVASNFQRAYREIAAREQEYERLPDDVKALVSKMRAEREALPGWKGYEDGGYDDDGGGE